MKFRVGDKVRIIKPCNPFCRDCKELIAEKKVGRIISYDRRRLEYDVKFGNIPVSFEESHIEKVNSTIKNWREVFEK